MSINNTRVADRMGHDPFAWAIQEQGSKIDLAQVITDGRTEVRSSVTCAEFFHETSNRPGIVLHQALGQLGGVHKVRDALWMIERIRTLSPYLQPYETIAWSVSEGWIILLEARARLGNRKPWQRTYHFVIQ